MLVKLSFSMVFLLKILNKDVLVIVI